MADENHSAPIVVRATATGQKGEPTLVFSRTSKYAWIWSTLGDKGGEQATIWRPTPATSDWMILGDFIQFGLGGPLGSSLIVKAVNDDPNFPLLRAPDRYTQVWEDRGSTGRYDGSIWRAAPHDHYLPIGCLGQLGYGEPIVPNYVCIRRDFAEAVTATPRLWWDYDSGAYQDVTCWALPDLGAFVAEPNHKEPYQGQAHAPKGLSSSG